VTQRHASIDSLTARCGLFMLSLTLAWPVTGLAGKCSIAGGETIRIASWNLNGITYRQRLDAGAFDALVHMVQRIDADVFAFQEVTSQADELMALIEALQANGRCYRTLTSAAGKGQKYAVIYAADTVELLYPEAHADACDATTPAPLVASAPLLRSAAESVGAGQPSQFAYFRVRDDGATHSSRFDFALINTRVHDGDAGVARLSDDFERLDQHYPWLRDEQDRILVGHLGVDATPARLRGNIFPQMKPLINPLLIISLGLSDMSFDEAVGRMSGGPRAGSAPGSAIAHYDNILVRRWDRPGICPSALYCGGLEEYFNAVVYGYDKGPNDSVEDFERVVSDHSPVSARFCKYADTDPVTVVEF
jgi:hypothetical protein